MLKQNKPSTLKLNCLLTRYPICFVHGLKNLFCCIDYWNGIPRVLKDHGYDTHELKLSWRGPNEKRLTELKSQVKRVLRNNPKVHLIGHSLGCLNILELSQDVELSEKIASITFVAPPFDGTPWAELGMLGRFKNMDLFKSIHEVLNSNYVRDLVRKTKIPPHILVGSIIANPQKGKLHPFVRIQHHLLSRYLRSKTLDPANDGLIPLASQRIAEKFGKIYFEFPGDHIQVIGGGPWPEESKTSYSHFIDHCIFLAEHDLKQSN